MKNYIILSTGGTGGHVYPALSLAAELRKQGYVTDLVTDTRGAAYQQSECFDHVTILKLPKANGVLGKVRQALSIGCYSLKLSYQFMKNKPSLVVGFGGYTSAPVVLAAFLLGINIVIHEQNAVLGRVNRFMGRFARKVALGMPVTQHSEGLDCEFVGNPVRQSILEAPQHRVKSDYINLFVFGGSQGADLFARTIPQAIAMLPESLQIKLKIVHQVRDEIHSQTLSAYDLTKANIETLQPFFSDMPQQLADADLIICRAGAMTVTEISVVGRAALFIPLRIAMDNHQYWNVKPIVDAGAAEMVLEKELSIERFADTLQKLLENDHKRQEMADKIKQFSVPNAVDKMMVLIKNALPGVNK